MKKYIYGSLLLIAGLILFISADSNKSNATSNTTASTTKQPVACKECGKNGVIINHTYYTICFDKTNKIPTWVSWELTARMVMGKSVKRKDSFRKDPMAGDYSPLPGDYKNTTKDRDLQIDKGHLCNADDMSFDSLAMSETFFMTNMTPQYHYFNGGIWYKLEEKERDFAKKFGIIEIIAGTILPSKPTYIGKNKVAVPIKYWKVIADFKNKKCIAFIFDYNNQDNNISAYVITVDQLEKIVGYNIFPTMPEASESVTNSNYFLN